MNYLQRLIREVRIVLFVALLLNNILLLGLWYAAADVWHMSFNEIVFMMLFGALIFNFLLEQLISMIVMQPIKLLWRNILRLTPNPNTESTIPKLTTLWLGADLVAALTGQVNQLAMEANTAVQIQANNTPDLQQNAIIANLPLPLLILDKQDTIVFANTAALRYFIREQDDLLGESLKLKLNMAFSQGEQDIDTWLTAAKTGGSTTSRTWDGVRVQLAEGMDPLQFDLAACYTPTSADTGQTLLVCFDHSAKYAQDNQDIGFISLAVHELRTPITMLRGYIEVLDEDLDGKLAGEGKDFFNKMKVASQQLNSFINNILNVARIEGDQLEVVLHEENWEDVLASTIKDLRLRAQVRGLELECTVAKDLPTVGADRFSITEVITNLVDNAIKYSAGKGKKIVIRAGMSSDGLVETTVTDNGVGIAESVVPTLFTRFQRNFHNRAIVSGTGLGLYLSKVIVNAHGGNIWVSSKEGETTTVGFTLLPYASLDENQKSGRSSEIIQSNHGWIKNHSMSRR